MDKQIEFTAKLKDGSVVWHDHEGNPAKDHRVDVPAGHPEHSIEISIKDKTHLGLSFDQDDPIHVWEGEGCPPPGISTDQIHVKRSSPTTIELTNRNAGRERILQYQLNIVGADGTKCPCDPIIKNGGGGGSRE